MTAEVGRAAKLITSSSEIVVISHERPDGDAVGSLLGLTVALQKIGKQAWPVLPGGLPPKWQFLPGADQVRPELPPAGDLIVTVDAADIQRLGTLKVPRVDLNIDHHPSNTLFGKINLVDPKAAATAALLYRLFPELGLPLELDVAINLLVGLITDTLGFRTSSVRPESLRIAAELMELGADVAELYRKALFGRSYEAVRYWTHGLSRMDMRNDVVWAVLKVSDRALANYAGSDDADLIDVLTTIEGPRVAILFVEQPDDQVKISWRALPGIDVSGLAASFGGGGHAPAAGAMIEGKIQEVVDRVLSSTFAAMAEANS